MQVLLDWAVSWLVWLMFGVVFIFFGAALVALVSSMFSSKKRLDAWQRGWLLFGLVGTAAVMWAMVVGSAWAFNYIAVILGLFVGAYLWDKFIDEGLELPRRESELFRS